ncbi:MAG: RNA-binding S4 domain-containing protein [Flavobacteriales bacterium]|nr:RNA-binding S4 domain-containing protein [Flavobacteriales bacterium]
MSRNSDRSRGRSDRRSDRGAQRPRGEQGAGRAAGRSSGRSAGRGPEKEPIKGPGKGRTSRPTRSSRSVPNDHARSDRNGPKGSDKRSDRSRADDRTTTRQPSDRTSDRRSADWKKERSRSTTERGTRDRRSVQSRELPRPSLEGQVRLNRYLAQSGICSRREADTLIAAGLVTVNGTVVTELGTKIGPGDKVTYGGERLRMEKKRYVLLNKPKDHITTTDDPHDRHTVMNLVRNACTERIYPVGRLDRMTTGLLLLTNDGDLAKRLTHPSHGARKMYHATLDKAVTAADLQRLTDGIDLEDGFAQVDEASFVEGSRRKEVGLVLHSGRNRIVRRLFEILGYNVVKLDRVVFAGLTKKDLPRGRWRHLTEKEVTLLQRVR